MRVGRRRHTVQLFDSVESRADSLAGYLGAALSARENALAVLTPANWCATAKCLISHGIDVEAEVDCGRLTVLDAPSTLPRILLNGSPDRARFDAVIGTVVRRLCRSGAALFAYGELVDLLAAERDFIGARQLEFLWNELLAEVPFSLFCGYSALNFGDPGSRSELRLICGCHGEVRTGDDDDLAAWLVKSAIGDERRPARAS